MSSTATNDVRSIGTGKLLAFGAASLAASVALGALAAALDVAWWVFTLVIVALVFLIAWYLRRRESGRWSYEIRHYSGEADGRRVELLFDERLVVLNRLTLLLDGEEVARETIFFGTKTLTGAPRAGSPVTVEVGSGWVGTCTGAVLHGPQGDQQLQETTGR